MFKLVMLEDVIRIPPNRFWEPIDEVTMEQLKKKYEGMLDEELGYIIAVIDVDVDPVGKIVLGDGGTYNRVVFTLLTFKPEIQEIMEGEVVEVADFGAFIRLGPIDALLHISQLMDDYISYDRKQGILTGKQTGRKLRVGDIIRVRVTAVSFKRGGSFGKVGVTARQPFLGKLEWIEEEVKRARGEEGQAEGGEGVGGEGVQEV